MNRASHSHWYPSVSILCQAENEVVGRALDLVDGLLLHHHDVMIWLPTFLMRQCGGLRCRCYLSSHLDTL